MRYSITFKRKVKKKHFTLLRIIYRKDLKNTTNLLPINRYLHTYVMRITYKGAIDNFREESDFFYFDARPYFL